MKIDQLLVKEKQMMARIQMAEARKKKEDRKNDTRRKILVGALILEHFEKNKKMDHLYQQLDKYLTRNSDRKLFNLPLLEVTDIKSKKK